MTTATRLFNILVEIGVRLWITIDNKLCWKAVKGVVTNDHKEQLAANKAEIIAIIKESQNQYIEQKIDTIIDDDCLHALRQMPTDSVDLVCTDPPYGLGFMNKKWDQDVPSVEIWQEVLRVMKPGGYTFVMSGPRQDMLREMTARLQHAGFETGFTSIYWVYATGSTKARAIIKLIQKRADAARKSAGESMGLTFDEQYTNAQSMFDGAYRGFHLKPAVEVVLVAMKPITEKSVIDQVMANGKPVTHLDDCRIPYAEGESAPTRDYSKQRSYASGQVPGSKGKEFVGDARGRFPANILVSDNILDAGGDVLSGHSRYFSLDRWFETYFGQLPESVQATFPFLIVSKPSKAEKERGLEHIVPQLVKDGRKSKIDNQFQRGQTPRRNTNPCVKPIKLMTYLVTLGSRPGDLIADPFVGSGSTCVAAKLRGRRYIGIDREEEYCRIAEARLAAVPWPSDGKKSSGNNDQCPETAKKANEPKKKRSSHNQWATKSVNFCTGCSNNCRYCYGRLDAVRFKQVTYDGWAIPRIRQYDVDKPRGNYRKTVMFPSSHDITPDNLDAALVVLGKLLSAGNRVLVVSKPHLEVIRAICDEFGDYRKSILFRFTITATSNEILAFWEPGAPTYEERREALAYAFDTGFDTSVSVEPMLDTANIDQLVADLTPRVSHSIWIGKMNYLSRIKIDGPEVEQELERIRAGQTDEHIRAIYNRYCDNPAIRWKNSIKDVAGIEPSAPGTDE